MDVLGIEGPRKGREPGEVGEEDGQELAFGRRDGFTTDAAALVLEGQGAAARSADERAGFGQNALPPSSLIAKLVTDDATPSIS